jgi:uncharacterized OB-fold protein
MSAMKVNSGARAGQNMVPLVEGLCKLPVSAAGEGHLIGRRCKSCGTYFYPNTGHQKMVCLNCLGRDLEEVALSSQGTLYSFTICHAKADFVVLNTPFAIGTILLPKENILVWTSSTPDCDLGALKVDMEVELVFEKVKEDAAGNAVMAFLFRPLGKASSSLKGGN